MCKLILQESAQGWKTHSCPHTHCPPRKEYLRDFGRQKKLPMAQRTKPEGLPTTFTLEADVYANNYEKAEPPPAEEVD